MHISEILERIQQAVQRVEQSQRTTLLARFAGLQTKVGRCKQAIQTALGLRDPYFATRCLVKVALYQAEHGHLSEAKQTFQLAIREALQHEDPQQRSITIAGVAHSQAEVGLFEEALQTLNQTNLSSSRRGIYLASVAIRLSEQGLRSQAHQLLAQAVEISRTCSDTYRDSALSYIAEVQAQLGWLTDAIETVSFIEDPYSRAKTLAQIAELQHKAGQQELAQQTFAEAIRVAHQITDAKKFSDTLIRIASFQAQAGLFEQAIQTVEQLDEPQPRAGAFHAIAVAFADAGLKDYARETFERAVQTALAIEAPQLRFDTLGWIGHDQAEFSFIEEAHETARHISDPNSRDLVYGEIAFAEARARKFNQALRTAQLIHDKLNRVTKLCEIANYLVDTRPNRKPTVRQVAQAKRIVDLARRLAVQIQSAHERNYAYEAIARSLAKVGNIDEALQVALQIETSQCYFMRARALEWVVHYLTTSEQVERALQIAEQFSEQSYEHACMLIQIAEVLVNQPH